MLSVRFWGVRGSIPAPGKNTVEFGGNTACLEIQADDRLIVVDFGSGAREFGQYLANKRLKADVFLTHTHLDHLIGFPLFAPFFYKNNSFVVHGPKLPGGKKLEAVLDKLLSYELWPLKLCEFPASIKFEQHGETTLDLGGGLKVKTKFLNHPVITLGYRFEYKGKSIVVSYDNEPFWNLYARSPNKDSFFYEDAFCCGEKTAKEENAKLSDFYRDADVLVYDTQYTKKEYESGKLNWGHSMFEYAEKMVAESNVKKIMLFHHDPARTDGALQQFENEYKNKALKHTKIIGAREGKIVNA